MSRISPAKLWRISRPRFWIYTFGPYIVGLLIGARDLDQLRDWRVMVFGAFFLLPANLFIYGVNDIFDYETDIKNQKKTSYEVLVQLDEQRVLMRTIALGTLPFLATLFFLPARAAWALGGFAFFSVFYSAPPIRAKARPVWDSMFNILYAFPAFFAYFLLDGYHFVPPYILAAWLWTMAMHAYSAVPDISADREAGLDTIATQFGFQSTLMLCLIGYALSALLSFDALGWLSLVLGAIYVAMMLVSMRAHNEERLLRVYAVFPFLNTAAGAALFLFILRTKFFL
jgi:4-hydroxybenzoate polyprenyltransferase